MISQARRRLIGRLRSRRRAREGAFLVEGIRGAEEALASDIAVRFAIVSEGLDASERGGALLAGLRAHAETFTVEAQELGDLADTEAPQGVLLVCEEPQADLADLSELANGAQPRTRPLRLLVLDGIQDPGNAGTLFRAASAFGSDAIVAIDGTVDPWNAKVVRATAGASFRIPVVRAKWNVYHEWLRERGLPLLVADARGEDIRSVALERGAGWALLVGNEGAGPRPEALEHAARILAIPMPGGVESLNAGVAGAILLYDLTGRE